ncbi:hypothetical protein HGRIS_004750 [Hohenbuehelia grisea]|uniref:Uncharacterized protein n=1 Tax=Hohenbuehelia grisea TaxID=104357 RepID=A0ABR3JD20_9AGAR
MVGAIQDHSRRSVLHTQRRASLPSMACTYMPWIVFLLAVILVLWLPPLVLEVEDHGVHHMSDGSSQHTNRRTGGDTSSGKEAIGASDYRDLLKAPLIRPHSMTAILPLDRESLAFLPKALETLLVVPSRLQGIWIVVPEHLLVQSRRIIRESPFLDQLGEHPDISLHPWPDNGAESAHGAVLRIADEVSSDWILILDENYLEAVDSSTRKVLLNPLAIPLPVGPEGYCISSVNATRVKAELPLHPASYLLPPFVIPTSLLRGAPQIHPKNVWPDLGQHVATSRPDNVGGLVLHHAFLPSVPEIHQPQSEEIQQSEQVILIEEPTRADAHSTEKCDILAKNPSATGKFVLVFPSLTDVPQFSIAACKIQDAGHSLRVLIYHAPMDYSQTKREVVWKSCSLEYDILPLGDINLVDLDYGSDVIDDWMRTYFDLPDIVVLSDDGPLSSHLERLLRHQAPASTIIKLPREDLPYTAWMGTLTLEEWKNWNTPRIDISVITKDRPKSLMRLLSSLTQSKFFGDSLTLRLNLDQPADPETSQIIDDYKWPHGSVFVHHRILPGGLLPAVVESWYPHSNDTYGLLLEDDVELSPLFYAWLKMSVLRYRYAILVCVRAFSDNISKIWKDQQSFSSTLWHQPISAKEYRNAVRRT